MKEVKQVSEDVKLFRFLAERLHQECKHTTTYAEVVIKLFNSRYSKLVDEITLVEIGYIFGITKEMARQIELKAISKLNSLVILQEARG